MIRTQFTSKSTTWNQRFCLAIIAFQLLWLGTLLPQWLRGDPPSYPRQYETRVLSTLSLCGPLVAVFIIQSPIFKTRSGRVVYWLSLGIAVAALIIDIVTHR